MRFRGELSQGLFLPLSNFPECEGKQEGDDVTALLSIRKWEVPEVVGTGNDKRRGSKPHGIPTTDETRIQSKERYLEQLNGHGYYITTKMDGTSCTMYHKDGSFGVCGRTYDYVDNTADDEAKENKASPMWVYAHKMGLPEKMKAFGRNLALQGEFCGEGIQKNRLRLWEPELFIFDAVDLDTLQYLSLDEMTDITDRLGLKRVPLEEEGEHFNYTLEEMLVKAQGNYPSGTRKEGIVVRSKQNIGRFNSRISFKVINNEFLLKEED